MADSKDKIKKTIYFDADTYKALRRALLDDDDEQRFQSVVGRDAPRAWMAAASDRIDSVGPIPVDGSAAADAELLRKIKKLLSPPKSSTDKTIRDLLERLLQHREL